MSELRRFRASLDTCHLEAMIVLADTAFFGDAVSMLSSMHSAYVAAYIAQRRLALSFSGPSLPVAKLRLGHSVCALG